MPSGAQKALSAHNCLEKLHGLSLWELRRLLYMYAQSDLPNRHKNQIKSIKRHQEIKFWWAAFNVAAKELHNYIITTF